MRNIEKQLVVNHVHAFKYFWRLQRKGRYTTFSSYFGMSKNAKKNRPYQWTVQQPVPQLYSFVFFYTMQ